MSTIRRKYTQAFKDSAVKLIIEQGYQLSEASRNIGINTAYYADGEMRQHQQKMANLHW